jgi:hypothetical protein
MKRPALDECAIGVPHFNRPLPVNLNPLIRSLRPHQTRKSDEHERNGDD